MKTNRISFDQTIKALECCIYGECEYTCCPLKGTCNAYGDELKENALYYLKCKEYTKEEEIEKAKILYRRIKNHTDGAGFSIVDTIFREIYGENFCND